MKKGDTVDPNAEKFDADIIMRSIECRLGDAVEYDTMTLNMETYAEDIIRKKEYTDKFMRYLSCGGLDAVPIMRFPPMP